MKLLLIHQNFPGQYLHFAQYLAATGEHEVVGLGQVDNIKRRGTIYGIVTMGYKEPKGFTPETHHYLQPAEAAIRRGQVVIRSLMDLQRKGFEPDVICVHPGWGEGLFLRELYPRTPIIMLAEFYFRAKQADLAFDPEFPFSIDDEYSIHIKNTTQLLSLPTANLCLSPTHWQSSRYPWYIREKMIVQHDGIDVEFMCPCDDDKLVIQPLAKEGESIIILEKQPQQLPGNTRGNPLTLTRKDKIISYVSRGLEPYRGFHTFMRALPDMQKLHPDAHIIIVGGDEVSYSPMLIDRKESFKLRMLQELEGRLNLDKIHFVGRIPYGALRSLFRITTAHVYLTYPFVLSWSVMEAMACSSLVIASRVEPVEEVIFDGETGVLVDFFNREELVAAVDRALSAPQEYQNMRNAARQHIVNNYALQSCLAKHIDLLHRAKMGEFEYIP